MKTITFTAKTRPMTSVTTPVMMSLFVCSQGLIRVAEHLILSSSFVCVIHQYRLCGLLTCQDGLLHINCKHYARMLEVLSPV